MKRNYTLLAAILLCTSVFAGASNIELAQELMANGKYAEALTLLSSELDENPNSKQSGLLNQLAGESAFNIKKYSLAQKYFEKARNKGVAEAYRFLGQIAFLNYDFDQSYDLYSKYKNLKTKSKKAIPVEAENEIEKIALAESFLDRVEKIVIIDSIAVDKKSFFQAYKISGSSGSLNSTDVLKPTFNTQASTVVYANEAKDYMMWAETDHNDSNKYKIVESMRLTDGTWHTPQTLVGDDLNGGGDANYPFMMTDGTTLYFANNGSESMGGYDIFVSNKDAETGTYMTPSNIGMPYNSPFDDYMYVVDETTGVGWWATDRNNLPDDKTTIYIFIPNDIRSNYDSDDDNIVDFARIANYSQTQSADERGKYAQLLHEIEHLSTNSTTVKSIDFVFNIGNGIIYYTLDDFGTQNGRRLMEQYLSKTNYFESQKSNLSKLRRQYHSKKSATLGRKISQLESDIESTRTTIDNLRKNIIKAERK